MLLEVKFPTAIPDNKNKNKDESEESEESDESDETDESDESDEDLVDKQPLSTKLLTLSWAITVHKSQGSQWRYVIFYIPYNMPRGNFFNRKLLYTGISRTQEMLYVVAENESAFLNSIFVKPFYRYDNLGKRLTTCISIKQQEPVSEFQTR